MILSIVYPIQNSIIERNYFKICAHCDANIKQLKFQLFNCNDFTNHKLVFEEIKINHNRDTEISIIVSPHTIEKDGLYGVQILTESELTSSLLFFNVKPTHGWETINQLPNLNFNANKLKNNCAITNTIGLNNAIVFANFNTTKSTDPGTIYYIDSNTFKIINEFNIPNSDNMIDLLFWKTKLIKIECVNEKDLNFYWCDYNNFQNWELFHELPNVNVNERLYFINSSSEFVFIYKTYNQTYSNEIHILHISENYNYTTAKYQIGFIVLKNSFYLYDKNEHSVLCICTKTNAEYCDIQLFNVSSNGCTPIANNAPEHIKSPDNLTNPIFIYPYHRIYWNHKNENPSSVEAWDINTFKKTKMIPHGGSHNLKNNLDGRLYSIGIKSEIPNMMYLKRYIE